MDKHTHIQTKTHTHTHTHTHIHKYTEILKQKKTNYTQKGITQTVTLKMHKCTHSQRTKQPHTH